MELLKKLPTEKIALALGVGVSVTYAGQHLDHLGTIAEGVRMGYVIPGMLSVIAYYTSKSFFSEVEETKARLAAGSAAVVVAVVSVNISGRAMTANDFKAVTETNRVALEVARVEYDQQEVIRMSQFTATIESGKAAKFAEKSSFLEVKINSQEETVKEARSIFNRWDSKLSKGSKQSADTQTAWKSAKADLEKERDILTELITQNSNAMSGAITTAETYQPAVFVEPTKKETDPFIWTYAGTIEAYLFFIAFMYRERKEKKLNLLVSKSDEKVKFDFSNPVLRTSLCTSYSDYVPRDVIEGRNPNLYVPRDVIEGRNTESGNKSNATDVAFKKAKKEAENALKTVENDQNKTEETPKKEQCIEAILNQTVPMRVDNARHVDKASAEDEFGRKAADFAFRKLVKSGQLVATGNTRNRRYAYPSNITRLIPKKG